MRAYYIQSFFITKTLFQSSVIIRFTIKNYSPLFDAYNISIKIFINHKNLMYFAEKRDLNRRQIKYLNMLFEYNIKIIYRPRSQNLKINIFIRIIKFKLTNPQDKR